MHLVEQARAALAAVHEDLPWALITLAALALCHAWRSFHLASWDKVAALLPKPDARGLQLALHRVVQGWPALALGAVTGAVSGGTSVSAALKGAAFGMLASVLVILRQYGAEWLAKFKGPRGPGGGLAAGVIALCLSCSGAQKPDPMSKLAAAQAECAAYDALPSDAKTPDQDRACYVVKRVCVDPLQPVIADPPGWGNKVVEKEGWVEL